MPWSLSRKVSAALVSLLLATMLMTALFGYSKFSDVLSELVNSRYSFVTFTIKRKVEDRLALGLPLRQLRQIQEVMELEKGRDEQIMGIQIYDLNREVLFDTERGAIGSHVPAAWLDPLTGAANGQPFSLSDEDSSLVGLPLVNGLGKVEGAVVLRYPAATLEMAQGHLLRHLAAEFAIVLVGFSLVAVMAASTLLRDARTRLHRMEQQLSQSLTPDGKPPAIKDEDPEFEKRFAQFCGKVHEAMTQMADTSDEVERLDRLA